MPDIHTYQSLPVEIRAIELTQYGDFVRAAKWATDNGADVVFSPAMREGDEDYLIVGTPEGNMEAGVGWFLIQGIEGEFYPCKGSVFRAKYVQTDVVTIDESTRPAGFTGTGAPQGGARLAGGATLPLPNG
jgi:hypothetical protein